MSGWLVLLSARGRTITQSKIQPKTSKTHPKTKKNETRVTTFDGCSVEEASLCADEFKKDLSKTNQPNITARSQWRCKNNTPISSAETQDPPSQDPGDRTVKPIGHEAPSQAWNDRALNWEATQRQAPCRGEQPKNVRRLVGFCQVTKRHIGHLFPRLVSGWNVRAYKGRPYSVSKIHINLRCKKRTQKLASSFFLLQRRYASVYSLC